MAVVVQIAYSTYGFHGKQESGLQQSETPKTAKAELVALLRISFFPISHEIMDQALVTKDGYVYEKRSIQEWFHKGNRMSPSE